MNKSPKVVFKLQSEYALNNIDRRNKNIGKLKKQTIGMFDYYADDKKRTLNMFDYYNGTLTKEKEVNIMLENGKYATKEEIEKRKNQYLKYIKNSNIWKCVLSFNNDYLTTNINYEKLQVALAKEILPMFFKKIGFDDIKNMSYQIALHSDTDNLHYHFSFVEKKPNFVYQNKIDYRRKLKIDINDINFLKNQIVHYIEKESIYKDTLININKDILKLKKYFDKDEKCFILYNKKDLMLESKIYRLGELLNKEHKGNTKIKYNSIRNKEITDLTKEIKKYIFKNNEFISEYNKFKNNINILNGYFKRISENNNINDYVNNDLTRNKEKYLNNYILNSIVNYANDNYKLKTKVKLKENEIFKDLISHKFKKNKIYNNDKILVNYLSNKNNKFINKNEIEKAIKNINYEMEEVIKEFSKLFNYEKEIS